MTEVRGTDRMRKVLMVAHTFPPQAAAGSQRIMRFVRDLPKFGWQPTVLTVCDDAIPEYCPQDRALLERLPEDLQVDRAAVWHPISRLRSLWKRQDGGDRVGTGNRTSPAEAAASDVGLSHSASTWGRTIRRWLNDSPDTEVGWVVPAFLTGLRRWRREGFDLIYATGPPHSAYLVATLLNYATRRPLVLDFRDPWTRAPWNPRHTVHHRLLAWQEARCVRRAAAVVLNTRQLQDEFQRFYTERNDDSLLTIPNGIDSELIRQFPLDRELPADRHLSTSPQNRFILCHPGTVYGRRDLRPVAQAVRQLRDEGVEIELQQIGQLGAESDLQQLARDPAYMDWLRLLPPMPHSHLLKHLATVDLFIVLQQGTWLQLPSKVIEMILFQRPILAVTGDGATADTIRRYHLGEVIDSKDPSVLAEAIRRLLAQAQSFRQTALLQQAYRDFDGTRLTRTLADVFHRVVAGPSVAPLFESIDRPTLNESTCVGS